MTDRFFVVCGNFREFQQYVYKHQWLNDFHRDFVFCDSVVKTRGMKDIHGVFYGTWYNLPDIRELLLHIRSRNDHLPLEQLYGVLKNVGK